MSLRRRALRWGLAAVVLAAAGVGGAVAILRSPWVESRIGELLVHEIERAAPVRASLGRARVTLWPIGLELRDLELVDTETGASFATLAAAHAALAIRDGTVKLGRVLVVKPRIRLSLDEQGRLRELRGAPLGQPTQGPRRPLTELPWSSLALVDAQVHLDFPDGEASISALSIVPDRRGLADLIGTVSVRHGEFADSAELRWPSVAIGPDRIEVPHLSLPFRSLQLGGALRWPLGRELDAVLQVDSELVELTPLLPGPRTLAGRLALSSEVTGSIDDPQAMVRLITEDIHYSAPGKVWPTVRYHLDALELAALVSRAGVSVERLQARAEDGHVRATARLEPVDHGFGPTWELTESLVFADAVSLAAILRAGGVAPNPWVDFTGEAEVRLSGPLSPTQIEGPFRVSLSDFEVRQGPVDRPESRPNLMIPGANIDGVLTIYKDHLVIDGRRFVSGQNRGTVVADIGYKPQGPLDLRVDLTQADLGDLRPLGGSGLRGRGTLNGRLAGDFNELLASGTGVIEGFEVGGLRYADELVAKVGSDTRRLWLTEVEARRGTTPYTGSFDMDFSRVGLPMDTRVEVGRGRVEDLLSVFLDLGDLVTGQVDRGDLWLKGPLNDLDGAADLRLSEVGLLSERFPTGRATGRMHDGTFTLDDLSVRRGQDEGLTLRGSVGRAWALDMVASGELRLETLNALADLGLDLRGRTSVLFTIDNTLLDPAPHGRIRLFDASIGGNALPESLFSGRTSDGVFVGAGSLLGDSVAVDLSAGLWGDQPYDVRASLYDLPIDLLVPTAADGQPIRARLEGGVVVSGNGGPNPSPVEVTGVFPSARFAWDRHRLTSDPERPWRLRVDGDRWSLRDVSLSGPASSLTLTAEGTAERTLIDGSGSLDADLLRAVAPGLERAEGSIDVAFTSRGGRETRVELLLDAPLLRHESVPAAFEDVRAAATLTPDAFTITDFGADLGGGNVVGDARRNPRIGERLPAFGARPLGLIQARDWVPTRFDLLAKATNVQMQWVDDLPPAVGDALLAFDGPADALLLHADIDVTEMAFTERIDWEDWVVALEDYLLVEAPPTDEEPWFGLDISIRANRTVRLLNNVSDATASADLKMVGDTSRMGLLGRVRVDDGFILLQDRAFDVLRGELRFDDPFSWDPLLDFDLRTDITSRARQYRINYRVSGPYSAWSSRTVSEPRLPQADINALLWFGVTADELEDMGELTSAVGMAAADFMFKDFIQNDYLGLGLRDAAIFDRLPRIELNTGVNLRGEYSSEPRALIRQRWSPTLSTLAEINLVRDDHFARLDWRTEENLILSSWWASRRREGIALPVSGALGVDLRYVLEFD